MFSVLLGLFVSTPVFASESVGSDDTSHASEAIESVSDELTPEMTEVYTKLLSVEELDEGDVLVLDTQDGEQFCATDTLHTHALDVTYSGKSYFIIFGASLNPDLTTLTLNSSVDYE